MQADTRRRSSLNQLTPVKPIPIPSEPDSPRRRPRQRAHAVRQAGRPAATGARAAAHRSGSAKADRGGLDASYPVTSRARVARRARPSTGRPGRGAAR